MPLSHWTKVNPGPFHFSKTGKRYPKAGGHWRDWVEAKFLKVAASPFAERHVRLWEWFESLTRGTKPRARVEIWGRGGAKSSSAEMGVCRVGAKQTRRFCVYVSATQGQANKHVQAIASLFAALGIGRAVDRYGNSLGWRLDILRCENGFSVLALGLDAAARGIKVDSVRPDLFVLDDVDDRHDTEETVKKKIATLTDSILPAGSPDAAVLFIQNRIHSGSIATMLAENTADFLLEREVYQEAALSVSPKDLAEHTWFEAEETEDGRRRYRVLPDKAEATWEGQDRETCERQFNEWGRSAFLREGMHLTDETEDGLWDRKRDIDPFRIRPNALPELIRIGVAIDPNATEGGDEAGIIVGGIARTNGVVHAYVLEDATVDGGPAKWAGAAVDAFQRWDGDMMVAEDNNGGEMVAITIGTVPGAPKVKLIHASRGKRTRAEPVQKLYEDGRVHHVGTFVALEKEQCTWVPGDPSPNRLDACVWLVTELILNARTLPPRKSIPGSAQQPYM